MVTCVESASLRRQLRRVRKLQFKPLFNRDLTLALAMIGWKCSLG